MSRTWHVICLSKATSPVTHMAQVAGNEAMIAREPVVTPRGITWIPVLSGNSIRHCMVRKPGVRWLIDQYGLAGKLNLLQLNFLFHGGSLIEGGDRENLNCIADMQRIFPLLRLLGGSLPNQVLSGSLLVSRGILVCRENIEVLQSFIPHGWMPHDWSLQPAENFICNYQYTRGDVRCSLPATYSI